MATDQAVWLIGMWMEVKPAIETTESEDEAGEVDCEAEQGDDGEPDVAQGADGAGSEMARLLGPPLVLGAPEPGLEGGFGCGALAERGLRWGALAPGVIVVPEGVYVGRVCPPGPVWSVDVTRVD